MSEITNTEEKLKNDQMTLKRELRTIYFSMIGFVFGQTEYMEDEYEFATWRRVILTVFIGVSGATIATEIARIVVFTTYGLWEYVSPTNELLGRFSQLVISFPIALFLAIATGYTAHLLLVDNEDDTPYSWLSYVQIIAIVKALQAILSRLFLEINNFMLLMPLTMASRNGVNPLLPTASFIIAVAIIIYLYYVLSKALKIGTILSGTNFWLKFIFLILWYEGLGYFLNSWIAPFIYRLMYGIF